MKVLQRSLGVHFIRYGRHADDDDGGNVDAVVVVVVLYVGGWSVAAHNVRNVH